jgi:hypothetical protein
MVSVNFIKEPNPYFRYPCHILSHPLTVILEKPVPSFRVVGAARRAEVGEYSLLV